MSAWLPMLLAVMVSSGVVAVDLKAVAPSFSLPDSQNQPLGLEPLRGKVVYVDFWASWCGPCRQSFPWMNQISQRYAKDGLQVVAINEDESREDADVFLKKLPAKFTVLFDNKGMVAKTYAIKGMPSSFLIDRHGIVRASHIGFRPDNAATLEAEIVDLLKQP